ncbi:ABC transporter substrate-binding protein [Capsulimonas corticalis]|uniref:ABC transporter substrate-binding protein n=1 Tax=Capsulimonas corticalis TaxID=2219043 RepID=A0A402D102_9BACT|nr:ABC transporter substrate-binding protein [Capsulimonas corticalis]
MFAVGAQDKLVGDTAFCDYPEAAKKIAHVGGPMTPSGEVIVAMRPDIVIMADQTITSSEVDQLSRKFHAPIYVTAAASYAGTEKNIAALGALVGRPAQTKATLDAMAHARRLVQKAVAGKPKPKAFLVIWDKPLMTASGASFMGDLVRLAGGTNVAEKTPTPYPLYSPESLVRDNPDILLTGADGTVTMHKTPAGLARLQLRAIRAGRCFGVPADWTNRPGPRLRWGLLEVAKALHPEAFGK